MTSGYPETTEQDPSVPMQPGNHRERLAKFVGELWAQRRHVVETGAVSIRDLRMRTTGLSVKTLNSWTELLSGYGKAQTIRAMTSIETRPHEREVGLVQMICSIELQRITLSWNGRSPA